MTALEDVLRPWLPRQRWYGGKGTGIADLRVESETPLPGADETRLTLLQVTAEDGAVDRYQLLVGRRTGPLEERLEHAVIGEADGATVYDAVHDPAATSALLRLLAEGGEVGPLRFHAREPVDPALPGRVLAAEQSNTSVVYGDEVILKLFRRLQPGTNPDIEVTAALAEAGSPHIAWPVAWYGAGSGDEHLSLGLLQHFFRGASDGWSMATASVRDLFAEGDLHADEVGGDFAGEAERLGVATAEVHALMAQALPTAVEGPEEVAATARQLHERLDAALANVPDLQPYADALRAAYDQVAEHPRPVPVQRVHGDYHLGQVLRTLEGWVLLDFEGEPARPLSERTALMSPLRDVAGMLRSFDYAARHLLAERHGDAQLAYRANEWAERNRSAFCDGYARAAGSDPRDESVLLQAFELDKAVYEVVYEARNRPTWLPIPIGSITRLSGAEPGAGTASAAGRRP
ncbi:MAG: aminoglycoside phosphotransferase [Actinomycetota bacterium]|nr:aminoglycoside phosphotransferase [Actinomycetota bacterium]